MYDFTTWHVVPTYYIILNLKTISILELSACGFEKYAEVVFTVMA